VELKVLGTINPFTQSHLLAGPKTERALGPPTLEGPSYQPYLEFSTPPALSNPPVHSAYRELQDPSS
jgi:hypothetical protein